MADPGSSERFGYEWGRYGEIYPEHEAQFRGWTSALPEEEWKGCTFLDAGCGMGRNSVWAMRSGAVGGVAVDLDARSLAQARRNLADYPGVEVRCQSIYDLPDRDRFDIVFSIGVIHHLEFPEKALQAMVRAAKPGGKVLIWVYGAENNQWKILLDPFRRWLFSRLPIGWVDALATAPALLLYLGLRLGLGRQPYFRLMRTFRYRHVRSIVFDQMLPGIAHYWPRDTVQRLMAGAGLKDVRLVWVHDVSWSAVGTRPLL